LRPWTTQVHLLRTGWHDPSRVGFAPVRPTYACALDAKDLGGGASCFTEEIETDYADLRGTGPERVSAQAFVDLRRCALEA